MGAGMILRPAVENLASAAACPPPAGRFSGPHLGLHLGADDGNRTRTISLGICPATAARAAELPIRVPTSDRVRPSFTGANGTFITVILSPLRAILRYRRRLPACWTCRRLTRFGDGKEAASGAPFSALRVEQCLHA